MAHIQSNKNNIFIILIFCTFIVISFSGIYICPLKLFFGIPCPLCGMTRALKAVIKLDFNTAFYFHPLWILAIISFVIWTLYKLGFIEVPKRYVNIYIYILIFLILIIYICRHMIDSPVVRINFNNSVLYKIIHITCCKI